MKRNTLTILPLILGLLFLSATGVKDIHAIFLHHSHSDDICDSAAHHFHKNEISPDCFICDYYLTTFEPVPVRNSVNIVAPEVILGKLELTFQFLDTHPDSHFSRGPPDYSLHS